MQAALGIVIALWMMLASAPAHAQLALYDDFDAKILDPTKWFGSQSAGLQESVRRLQGGRLRMAARGAGNPQGGGALNPRISVDFPNPGAITAMKATVTVLRAEASGCLTGDPLTDAGATARMEGTWFNTGVGGTPTAGSSLNDVFAGITVGRNTVDTDPPGTLRVITFVFRCDNAECSTLTVVGEDLGPVPIGVPVMLVIEWDAASDQFIFTRDQNTPVNSSYAGLLNGGSDAAAPSFVNRRLRAGLSFGCAENPRPTGFIDALFDDVMVNQSALP